MKRETEKQNNEYNLKLLFQRLKEVENKENFFTKENANLNDLKRIVRSHERDDTIFLVFFELEKGQDHESFHICCGLDDLEMCLCFNTLKIYSNVNICEFDSLKDLLGYIYDLTESNIGNAILRHNKE